MIEKGPLSRCPMPLCLFSGSAVPTAASNLVLEVVNDSRLV